MECDKRAFSKLVKHRLLHQLRATERKIRAEQRNKRVEIDASPDVRSVVHESESIEGPKVST